MCCKQVQLLLVALLAVLAHGQEMNFSVPGKCVGPNFIPDMQHPISPFIRPHEGFGNNPFFPTVGNRGRVLTRLAPSAYADGVSLPSGACLPGSDCPNPGEHILGNGTSIGSVRPLARRVSNIVHQQGDVIPSERGLSDIAVHWGQTLAHDTELTPPRSPLEALHLQIPEDDGVFDPVQPMDFFRSIFEFRCTGEQFKTPREQLNFISAFIDGTFVYGATLERAEALRGENGMMRLSPDGLPPRIGEIEAEADNPTGESVEELFFCGDPRCNEAIGLLSIITLFLREHNRRAAEYLARFPNAPSNAVYEWSRKMTIATVQSITFNEYFPALFGVNFPPYRGFHKNVQAELNNVFSTAARRFGHSQINPTIEQINSDGEVIRSIRLERTLFHINDFISPGDSLDPFYRGFLAKRAQQIDRHIDNAVRNNLFAASPGRALRDLAATNIQRGREHGLPSFEVFRRKLRLKPVYRSTDDISCDATTRGLLRQVYDGNIKLVDFYTGSLAENRLLGSEFGVTLTVVLVKNFISLREGDRFWYERILGHEELEDVQASTLAEIIRRNTGLKNVPRANLFFDQNFCAHVIRNQCIPKHFNLSARNMRQLKRLASFFRRSVFLKKLAKVGILSDPKQTCNKIKTKGATLAERSAKA